MGFKFAFHKWPFEQQQQIISQLTFHLTKEAQITTFPLHAVMVWPHAWVNHYWPPWTAAVHTS